MKANPRRQIFPRKPRHAMDLRAALEMHKAIESLLRLQVVIGTGDKPLIQFAEGNVTIILPAGTAAGSAAKAFAITQLTGEDYVIARELTNFRLAGAVPTADVGTKDFKIAKPPTIRRSVLSEVIDGITITYTDTGTSTVDNNRIANDGSQDESQCVYPRFITLSDLGFSTTVPANAQCVIYAVETKALTGVFDSEDKPLDWLEVLPARVWAKRFAP